MNVASDDTMERVAIAQNMELIQDTPGEVSMESRSFSKTSRSSETEDVFRAKKKSKKLLLSIQGPWRRRRHKSLWFVRDQFGRLRGPFSIMEVKHATSIHHFLMSDKMWHKTKLESSATKIREAFSIVA